VSDAIRPSEAAAALGVSTRTVQRWLRSGRLPAVRVGSRLKVDRAALGSGRAETKALGQPGGRKIERLLVANRGELVARIARTCRRLGITCLALVPEDQARAWWTGQADEIVPLCGGYLDAAAVLESAGLAGADAIHPGYGFLAESADFAAAVVAAGLTWVGPPPAAMCALGDKAAGRRLAQRLGVPVLPGYDGAGQSDAALRRAAAAIGYPLLVKPSAGGGGMGMHVADDPAALRPALAQARREAAAAFGDERVVLERLLARPRHIEIQLLCDKHGAAIHLGERECTLQRRHQKVIEEAPSPAVGRALRRRLGEAAVKLARAAGYAGVGTAEFLLDTEGSFYFLELNARLQVEHPVTELVTGRDLVADQLAIAAGERLNLHQRDVVLAGHAIEARLYAEDPWAGFLPAAGEILDLEWPAGEGVRVDAGVAAGDVIGTRYDPLMAKLIAFGDDRAAALGRLSRALAATKLIGVTTNRGFLRWLLERPEVVAGRLDTELIERLWQPEPELPDDAWRTAAALLATGARAGFRLNASPRLRVEIDGESRLVAAGEAPPSTGWARLDDSTVLLDHEGRQLNVRLAPPPTVEVAVRHAAHHGATSQSINAPLPGSVLAIHVAAGDEVEAGQTLVVLEAMKMENAVVAPAPGRVERVLVEPGRQVGRGEPLVELA
jgi:acetyl-CoA/propionyl-CoA carboxylase biotin carboxyl carrier protein